MSRLEITGLRKQFGTARVLDEVALAVESGEYLVLLGASGSGKTTLLRTVAGLLRPDAGCITVGGRDVTRVPPRRRGIAMTFQTGGLYPHLSIRRSLAAGLSRAVNSTERNRRVESAARTAELPGELLERYPDELSGGQLRRAAIAKTLVSSAGVRLLDEPLSALDGSVRFAIQQTLRRQHAVCPVTTIHVTHDSDEAFRLADRIAVIGDGRILQVGSPEELSRRPSDPRVAAATGVPPVNRCAIEGLSFFASGRGTTDRAAGSADGDSFAGAEAMGTEHALVCFRPEAATIKRDRSPSFEAGPAAELRLPGRVEWCTFAGEAPCGRSFEVCVRLDGRASINGETGKIHTPRVTLRTNFGPEEAPRGGEHAVVCVAESDLSVF